MFTSTKQHFTLVLTRAVPAPTSYILLVGTAEAYSSFAPVHQVWLLFLHHRSQCDQQPPLCSKTTGSARLDRYIRVECWTSVAINNVNTFLPSYRVDDLWCSPCSLCSLHTSDETSVTTLMVLPLLTNEFDPSWGGTSCAEHATAITQSIASQRRLKRSSLNLSLLRRTVAAVPHYVYGSRRFWNTSVREEALRPVCHLLKGLL